MLRLTLAVGLIATLAGCAATPPDADPAKGTTAPFYSCYRHIYNDSACPWTFQADSRYGNVYFGGSNTPGCTQANGPCTLQGRTSIEIHYTFTGGVASGFFNITDQAGVKKSWPYSATDLNQCIRIQHSGSTGAIAMNEPVNGDMTAWGACTWADGDNKPWPQKQSRPPR